MSIEMQQEDGGKILTVRISGKLEKEDYKRFVPKVERLIGKHGKLRILVEMNDFHGWDAGALWEDIKFDVKHFDDIERLALVGKKKWQEGMSVFCEPFTTAEIRYFERGRTDEARDWLRKPIAPEKKTEGNIILTSSEKSEEGFQAQPAQLKNLIGKSGKAITPLRPTGSAMIDENRVDVVTEGDFIKEGTKIEVVAVEGNRVVVRDLSS